MAMKYTKLFYNFVDDAFRGFNSIFGKIIHILYDIFFAVTF